MHQIHAAFGAANDEVHFAPGFVLPIEHIVFREACQQGVQHQMLPEQAAVVIADGVPATLVGDEASVEGLAFGAAHDLLPAAASAAVEGTEQVDGNAEVVEFAQRRGAFADG